MKRPDVFTELEAAAVGCIALEGTCIRSAYVHDLYVLICDYKPFMWSCRTASTGTPFCAVCSGISSASSLLPYQRLTALR